MEALVRRIRHDIREASQHIQEPKTLKASVAALFSRYGTDRLGVSGGLEADIQQEYERQREYLEKSVDSLKRRLTKDMELYRSENMRIMQENVSLIKEINELRRENKMMKQRTCDGIRLQGTRGDTTARETGIQKEEIRRLRERIAELERRCTVGSMDGDPLTQARPESATRTLPPLATASQ
eukprot:TRINITY_DN4716_c0_g2_i2.p1 TRINITY_DN4716_c0_g2~~TRINITY_DN4716_c0_g2_i2.p1  ORF type:complete len:182 (+),score=32.48 TRINITY_DN4716_c0_g2_i2:335-880(+)